MQVVHTDTICTKITQRLCADVLYFHTVRTFLRRASCRHELSHNAGDRFLLTMGACHAAELRSRIPRYALMHRAKFSRTVLSSHALCHILTHCATFSRTVPHSHAPCHILTHRATFSRTVPHSRAPCHILAHRATLSRTALHFHAPRYALTKCVTDFHIVRGLAFMQVVHTDTACTKITQRLCADVLYFHTARTFLRRASRRHELYPIMPVTVSPLTMGACHAAELRSHELCYALMHRAMLSRTV